MARRKIVRNVTRSIERTKERRYRRPGPFRVRQLGGHSPECHTQHFRAGKCRARRDGFEERAVGLVEIDLNRLSHL